MTWKKEMLIADIYADKEHITSEINDRLSLKTNFLLKTTENGHVPNDWFITCCNSKLHFFFSTQDTKASRGKYVHFDESDRKKQLMMERKNQIDEWKNGTKIDKK